MEDKIMSRIWIDEDIDKCMELCNELLFSFEKKVRELHPELSDIEASLIAYKECFFDMAWAHKNICENWEFVSEYEKIIDEVKGDKKEWSINKEVETLNFLKKHGVL